MLQRRLETVERFILSLPQLMREETPHLVSAGMKDRKSATLERTADPCRKLATLGLMLAGPCSVLRTIWRTALPFPTATATWAGRIADQLGRGRFSVHLPRVDSKTVGTWAECGRLRQIIR